MRLAFTAVFSLLIGVSAIAQPAWQTGLDSKVKFYQPTDFGIVLTATERSLYAIDGVTGERLWRRETGRINETAITPIPGTDLVLFSRDLGSKSRLEAVDIISGDSIWTTEKFKGDVLQLAADPELNLLAVVMVKDTRGQFGREMKREPVVHMLKFSTGDELWKKTLESDVEMMPAEFGEGVGEVSYTLDNYRAPLLIDRRLYLFYEGATSYDAETGSEIERETFKVNESGLALTEADPVFDDSRIYISGRGRIRAVDRKTGTVAWKADDLGNASEMAVVGNVLYVRTGGRFTRLRDGEITAKGPYGVSAIDTATGKTLWRFKGADKGMTNFVFADLNTIVLADDNEVITLNATDGKRTGKFKHGVKPAEFLLINRNGDAVIGGVSEIAAFSGGREAWRVKHSPPGRGVLRIVGGIALRAASLYLRYGGLATSAIGLARGGIGFANAVNSFRWSGLNTRFGSFDLTTLASNPLQSFAANRIYALGSLGSLPSAARGVTGFQVITPAGIRSGLARGIAGRATPSAADMRENIFDRLDPARYADRLSNYLLRRKRVSELRGSYMYYYTDLPRPYRQRGLIGVDVNSGRDARVVLASDPDRQFYVDETVNLLYSADGNRMQAFDMMNR
ncbi:MAG: PQQ-binding-like beta-propeller repeat protein [Pyrinomonadaceae bacterium]|nr:PQQ-binding-like beta-propeller repeat protein [Pyrinomonadaceae bacterium]